MASWQRTHTCGELRAAHIGQTVVLNGWVNTMREHPGQVFVDLRDRYGLTQCVFENLAEAAELQREWVLSVKGVVRERIGLNQKTKVLEPKHNTKIATGEVEVLVTELCVLNRCPTPPFEVQSVPPESGGPLGDPALADEETRLQYRFLDLRRPTLQRTLALRHRLNKVIRDHLDTQGFLEIETPLLGRSTPEGARDYLVPSRLFHGCFYALPQSPQLYKQLLMVAGYDKYFQIARCLRDEDLRADRQPEFTQLDVEMSYVEQENIFCLVEGLVADIFQKCLGVTIPTPFQRMPYEEAMRRFGSDKPDLRYGMELVDVTDLVGPTGFVDFQQAVDQGGKVVAINAKGGGSLSRKILDGLATTFRERLKSSCVYAKFEKGAFATGVAKFLGPIQAELVQRLGVEEGDLLFFGSGHAAATVQEGMGSVRTHLALEVLKLVDPAKQDFRFLWVVDFPSFIWDPEENRWAANHHPFTAPRDEDLPLLETDPGKVFAKAYDLVLNGYEVGGGSIRIHSPEVQQRLFAVLGMSQEQARERFGFLLDALQYGAPPHGGIALGLDRFAMLLSGTTNIRDVIAFPKNQRGRDMMTGAPAPVEDRQVTDLGLGIVKEEKP
jgi:aspartyl-tRNA synthetase